MSYVDGFVLAVPADGKERFLEHAELFNPVFKEYGARRILECWEDDVRDGSVTDFRRAVKAEPGESVVFSWIEWPDKATRDAAMARLESDPRFQNWEGPMPFDGKRMIMGGFLPVYEI